MRMMMRFVVPGVICRLFGRLRRVMVMGMVGMPDIGLDVMVFVARNHLVGMLELHRKTRTYHVNKRDSDDQEAMENAAHGWDTELLRKLT